MSEEKLFDKAYRIIIILTVFGLVAVAIVSLAGIVRLSKPDPVSAGQSIQFDGRTLDLGGASSVVIQSSAMTQTWEGVTQYTSSVTVTIYREP